MNRLPENHDSEGAGFLETFAWLCAAVAFAPIAVGLYGALIQSRQLGEAVVILAVSLAVLAIEYGIKPHRPRFSGESARWLLFAYIALFSAKYFGIWGVFLSLGGFSAAVVAFGLAFFDRRRYVYAAGGAFYAFSVLSFFVRAFDLPLRVLAGKLSAWILSLMNSSVALIAYGGDSPQIALKVDGRSYLVATECNGFGIISGCIILAVVCAIFRKNISAIKRAAIVAFCAVFAYVFNSFRIVAIICLAPIVGQDNYHFMHESAGYFFFALALLGVWGISRRL